MILFSFEYPPIVGGISRLCAEIVAGYERQGIPVSVLTQAKKGDAPSMQRSAEERVSAWRPWREISAWQRLQRMPKNELILTGIWYPDGLLALLASRRPLVILALGLELMPPRSRWRRPIWRWLQQKTLSSADLIIAISSYTMKLVKESAPVASVVSIPLAVDHQRFCPGDKQAAKQKLGVVGKKVLCSVSRIKRHKGHETIFQALASLPEAIRTQYIYLIGGEGGHKPFLEDLVKTSGLTSVVRWLGHVPETELPDLYRAADLFVLCSRENIVERVVEGFGLVFLEAQACGTPVIGTRIGGIPDAITHGQGGWLIAQDDVQALRKYLLRLVDEPTYFEQAGYIARQRVEHECTWDLYIKKLIDELHKAGIVLE